MRNAGELAEGWYDPATLEKAVQSAASTQHHPSAYGEDRPVEQRGRLNKEEAKDVGESDESEDDVVGPTLPPSEPTHTANRPPGRDSHKRAGPAIPNTQDLQLKRGKNPSSHPHRQLINPDQTNNPPQNSPTNPTSPTKPPTNWPAKPSACAKPSS